jgi:hypothetical protein
MILRPFTNRIGVIMCFYYQTMDLRGLIVKATGFLVTHMPSIVHWSSGFVYCYIRLVWLIDRKLPPNI